MRSRRSPSRPPPRPALARRPRFRARIAALALAAVVLAGCAPAPSPDPALVALQGEALGATRSAQLGEQQRADGRMFQTTALALLGDMEEKLADVGREAALHPPADATDAAFRDELLSASRVALDAVQAAIAHDPAAGERLDDAEARLEDLGGDG